MCLTYPYVLSLSVCVCVSKTRSAAFSNVALKNPTNKALSSYDI